MTRMRAEQEAARRNGNKAMREGGLSYTAATTLGVYGYDWAVVTWQNGKPIKREY